jgi:hypothetical protein
MEMADIYARNHNQNNGLIFEVDQEIKQHSSSASIFHALHLQIDTRSMGCDLPFLGWKVFCFAFFLAFVLNLFQIVSFVFHSRFGSHLIWLWVICRSKKRCEAEARR